MRIVLDQPRCQGHGRCYALAPELFDADDEGYALVRGDGRVPEELAHQATLAVDNCPEFAIAVTDDDA
jgi:ferredoxin